MRIKSLLLTLPLLIGVANAELEQRTEINGVTYHKLEGMPMSESVEIDANKSIVFLSGKVPQVINPDAPKDSLEAYGDTEAQTINILEQIDAHLAELNLSMEDVVKMQVFLVGGEENDGLMDFWGFMKGYEQFFDEKSTRKLPARSAFQVAKLAHPAWRVEIEVTAVRP